MTRTVLLLLALGAQTAAAQNTLAGTWQVNFPGSVRMMNGEATVEQASGVLTVSRQGDSIVGLLVVDPGQGPPGRPPFRMTGVGGTEEATLLSSSKAKIMLNGEESEATVRMTWKLKASGDSLLGTLERQLEGDDQGGTGPLPVRGKRRTG
jgi:hypothetical protein